MHTYIYTCIYLHIYIHIHSYTYTHSYVCVCMCVWERVCGCEYVYFCAYVCVCSYQIYVCACIEEPYYRDLRNRPTNLKTTTNKTFFFFNFSGSRSTRLCKRNLPKRRTKERYQKDLRKRPTKETYKRLQKRPTKEYSMDMTHEIYKRDVRKRDTKETHNRDLQKRWTNLKTTTNETYNSCNFSGSGSTTFLQKKFTKETYQRDLQKRRKIWREINQRDQYFPDVFRSRSKRDL